MSRAFHRHRLFSFLLLPLLLMLLLVLALFSTLAWAQSYPPNAWHPYQCGTDVSQTVDANGNFNCAGQTLLKQATPPTCGIVNGGNAQIAGTCVMDGVASDSALRGHARSGNNATNHATPVMRFTFAKTWPNAPACVASLDFNENYRYYLYGVTTTTTSVTLKLARQAGVAANTKVIWPPQAHVNVVCTGAR